MAMKKCKSCGNEVAKSAKVCPGCGQKLKLGFLAKFGILVIAVIAMAVAFSPSSEDVAKRLAEIENSTPSAVSPSAELAGMFSMISDSTNIQRENKEAEIKGSIVEWSLPVFDVSLNSKEKMIYRVQTSSRSNSVGTFVYIHARNEAEMAELEALSEGEMIKVKGEITGISMRNVVIENARLSR